MRVEITALGETLLNRDLLRFQANLEVPVIALQDLATMLRAITERQFDTEGANSGGWTPLAASTVAYKARHGLDPHILQATGRLKDALTRKFDPEHTETLSADSLRFGTTVPYGIFHQTGTSRMPKRPPLALTAADRVGMIKMVQKALLTGVRA